MIVLTVVEWLAVNWITVNWFSINQISVNQISVDWFPCCRFTAPAHPTSTASGAGMFRYFLFALISFRLSLFAYLFSLICLHLPFSSTLASDWVVIFYIKRTRVTHTALWSYEQTGIRVSLLYPFHADTACRKDSILDKSFSPRLDSTPLLTSTA